MQAPRQDLVRMIQRDDAQASVMQDGNTLVGYAAPFNSDTVINSWEGHFIERIAPGAFTKTLAERGAEVKVLWNHGMDPSIGDKPLGKPRVMEQRDGGLWTETPLSDTSYNQDIRALVNDGAVDGMSFRFSVIQDDWTKPSRKGELPVRTLKEVRLHEFGPVTFPAYAAATAGIRSSDAYRDWQEREGMTGGMPMTGEQSADPDPDEDPGSLAQAIDAILDEAVDALSNGETDQALALLVGAEATVDTLLELLGLTDADDTDGGRSTHPATSHRSTLSTEAGKATSGKEPRKPAIEPVINHSTRFTQLKARARVLVAA